MRSLKIFKLIVIIIATMVLSSCAIVPGPSIAVPPTYPPAPAIPYPRQDIFHIVAPGETLWRIGKIYDVDISDIMRANKLADEDELTMGEKLLIPKAMPASAVITLYPSNKWKYIIIHHSASDEGNMLLFHKSHTNYRGFSRGLGYHFLIDNGTYGKPDGYIEVSPRWIKQQDGAHCKASRMNYKSIGVCLVGNFSKDEVSRKQMSSLVYLVNLLRRHYRIPLRNIMSHKQVSGASTECPGKKFPWSSFISQLKKVSE